VTTLKVVAVDLGAESGRVFLASYDGACLSLQEVHRFPNYPVQIGGHLYWNVLELWRELRGGLQRACSEATTLTSVGVDTWGVDYGLVDAAGFLLGCPFHYRDTRTRGVMERVFERVPPAHIYARTGIQLMPINTIYQLVAQCEAQPELMQYTAYQFLLMPDLFHAWLSGERASEYTNATTTQLWSVPDGRWASDLFDAVGIPAHLAPPVVEAGMQRWPLLPELREEVGSQVQLALPATHDTACAVAGVPADGSAGWAYISLGTWSLVGLELIQPLLGPEALGANFTNEGGVFGTVRFLKNVMGLWLLQECRRWWEKEGEALSYNELFALAGTTPALTALIDPDDPSFLPPGNMPARIRDYLVTHGQLPPADVGGLVRCVLESLVLRCRQVLEAATAIADTRLRTVHVVGGGSRIRQFNQWLADALGLPVVAGPAEATVLGNALMQLVALGELHTLQDVRSVAVRSASTTSFEPDLAKKPRWDEAYARVHPHTSSPLS
jgi:rhamnulokinase